MSKRFQRQEKFLQPLKSLDRNKGEKKICWQVQQENFAHHYQMRALTLDLLCASSFNDLQALTHWSSQLPCRTGSVIIPTLCLHACSVASVVQTLCDAMDCGLPDFSVHGILQARTLEWVAIPSFRGSSQPRDWTWVSCIAYITGRFLTTEPLGKPYCHFTDRHKEVT